MYNKDLEKLIDLLLLDGRLGKDEEKVLMNKAKALGVDQEEFAVVLAAKVQEKQIDIGVLLSPEKEIEEAAKGKPGNSTDRCPACNGFLSPLSKVCPSCSYVADADSKEMQEQGLQDLVQEAENTLVEIKSKPVPGFFQKAGSVAHIMLPALTVACFILAGFKNSPALIVAAIFLAIISFIKLGQHFRSRRYSHLYNNHITIQALKAKFEKSLRMAKILYGQNARVSELLLKLNMEAEAEVRKHENTLTPSLITYGALSIIIVSLFIFMPEGEEGNSARSFNKIAAVDSLIMAGRYDLAEKEALELKVEKLHLLTRARIQHKELVNSLGVAGEYAGKQMYKEAQNALQEVQWQILDQGNYFAGSTEDLYLQDFMTQKGRLNALLPKAYRIDMDNNN